MATAVGEEETEYESDPEEAKLSLAMRRREASDDEEDDEEEEEEEEEEEVEVERPRRPDSRVAIDSDVESDGQGGAAEYDDEEYEVDDEEEDEEVEEEDEEEVEVVAVKEKEFEERERDGGGRGGENEGVPAAKEAEGARRESVGEADAAAGEGEAEDDGLADGNQVEGEEKKENEPFSVPTAGAFYMHDDRFRDNAGGRHRRTFGGRKLWESKDDRKWGHDKFEEMTMHERHHEEGRRGTRGNYRARGKNSVSERGYARGNRSKAYNNGNNQNQAPKSVRGRGPRRYEPLFKNKNEAPMIQNKQSGRSLEKASHTSSGRVFIPTSNVESDPVPPVKSMVASSLSSASPPFYPSGASNKDVALAPKRDVQSGNSNKNFSMPQSNPLLRGKNIVGSVAMDKLYIDNNNSRAAGKHSASLQLPPSGSFVNATQTPQSRAQGRGLALSGQMHFQPTAQPNQANRVSPTAPPHAVHRSPVHRAQPSAQTMGQRTGNVSQASSPPRVALSINSIESGEMESTPESSKSKTALVGKGNGRSPFLYNGAQVMGMAGNMGVGRGDQNFPGTFLPVMQFGGQHPGGMGVPAVGMAFPGYVGQPQGMGNSEMTWLPVLAGAAGALGATYPYIAGAYHARPSGQTSSSGSSSKENTEKASNDWKPSQRPELVGDEFGQRQNKPRRYSEMNFGQ